ncbi:MAG: ABC transporter permease [Planctomycetota bacterium]
MAANSGPWRRALARFERNRVARRAAFTLLILYAVALLAEFVAPYTLDSRWAADKHHPPNLHWIDAAGRAHLWPFVQKSAEYLDEHNRRQRYVAEGARYPLRLLVRGERYRLLGLIPSDIHLFGVASSAEGSPRVYLLGAMADGRDLFSALVHGSRISLTVGLIGVAFSFAIGLLVGGFSGYVGGKVDLLVQRLIESIMILPGFYVILAIQYAFGDLALTAEEERLSSTQVFLLVVVVLSFIYWAGLARVIRGQVLSIRARDHVVAARALGVPGWGLVLRHVLPHTMSYAIVAGTLAIPGFILMESALSMLGLGIKAPQVSWGNLLADAMSLGALRERPWSLAPGLLITIAVTAFNFVGDGLRDALDPESS